jgi:hypothetical protein
MAEHVYTQTAAADAHSPGSIAEGWFTVVKRELVLTDAGDKVIARRKLAKGDDPYKVAQAILRARADARATDPHRKLRYPNNGYA